MMTKKHRMMILKQIHFIRLSQHFKHDMPLQLLIHLFVGFPTYVAFKNKNYMPILLEKQIRHCSTANFLCLLDDREVRKLLYFLG
jgi:hypothetical protein